MQRFTELYLALDATTRTLTKQNELETYFRGVAPADAAWATFFLTGRKLKRLVRGKDLRDAALAATSVPAWLFDASYDAVGDLAETIALLLPPPQRNDDRSLTRWVEDELAPLAGLGSTDVQRRLVDAWSMLTREQRFVHIKLITGAFRVGVARQLVYRALSSTHDVPVTDVAERLIGDWAPSSSFVDALRGTTSTAEAVTRRPYPFFLANALDIDPTTLGNVADWQAEWKWDGIRAQLVVRGGRASLWSRGEELIDDAFPDLVAAAARLPDGTVLDGEILVWPQGEALPASFASLQSRLNRKAPGSRLIEAHPASLCVYDLLELDAADLRSRPLATRRSMLEALLSTSDTLRLSPTIPANDWNDWANARAVARAQRAEGVMLKRRDSAYGVGRTRGPWWKWKVDAYTVDAVMVYAQAGSGRRASLFTDYTFAVWDDGALVPFAKAYSGLSDAEIRKVDAWIRGHTLERFGPVRRVEPVQVFEIAFEGVQSSARHKSGIAVRFPRIVRWRTDKAASEADTLVRLHDLARHNFGQSH
ncbi:MAG TPA: ATP-dependent DNA ligase [Casimicrobiaceae bacterium]|nr:ATP-dependent DNA ligase [Casimicrobiaceae bacterium]